MRIVTWNCCRGPLARKLDALDTLNADVAVLQECPRPAVQSDRCLWFGDNPRQGIAVLARGAYRLRRLPMAADAPNYVMPVRVSGPQRFSLLAVWAMAGQPHRYVAAVVRAVELYARRLRRSPWLLLGDLNSNACWDATHSQDTSHSALVRRLAALRMQSCYHAHFDEAHGAESVPTFHLYRHEARPYHLDYCFAPAAWLPALRSVSVGDYATWAPFSDHRPMLMEFDIVAA